MTIPPIMMTAYLFLHLMALTQPAVEWGIAEDHGKLDKFSGNATNVSITMPRGCKFIGHTHDDFGSPYPSRRDIAEAVATQTPDLVVSRQAAYLVNVDGTVVRVQ
jgi:hypothetical protein